MKVAESRLLDLSELFEPCQVGAPVVGLVGARGREELHAENSEQAEVQDQ